ncbi:MAG: segregation and condensation protein A [Burkholderiales bacterium]
MSEVLDNPPIAKLYGEPLCELPADLYIPPDALELILENFEGPMDLLLYLIRKHNFDVLDIPMAELTRQYLEYVELVKEQKLELAAEYLLMAAMLLEIKSRMLLPKPLQTDADEEDPRAELVARLVEYEKMKLGARQLDTLPQAGRDFKVVRIWFEREATKLAPKVNVEDLRAAWLMMLNRAKLNRHHKVSREELSVREHMGRILRRLKGTGYVEFSELFDARAGTRELIVSFLALLELARESLIELSQSGAFSPIYARLKDAA